MPYKIRSNRIAYYQVEHLVPANHAHPAARSRQLPAAPAAQGLEVRRDLLEALGRELLVEALEEGDVDLEVLVVVAHVDEGPEKLVREDELEGLAVLLHRVQEAEQPQAQQLHFVLRLDVLARILALQDVNWAVLT